MRVLITTIGHLCDHPGGGPRVAFDEAIELERRGIEVWILACGDPALPEYELKDKIHLLRYSPLRIGSWNPARGSAHQKAASAVLARHLPQVDVIHGHVPLAGLAALDFYGDSVDSCYTILSPVKMEMAIVWKNAGLLKKISSPLGQLMVSHIEGECLRRSRVITAMSQYTIDCIGKIHGETVAKRIQMIPGWVDTSRFVPLEDRISAKIQLGWQADVPILFTLRRLVSRMGLDRLLDACHVLLREGMKFRLMIGGEGPLRNKLEAQVMDLGLSNAVTFIGRVGDQELPLAYAACDAFVLPTAELECFGLIALEALSAGRPVLATPVGAIPEVVRRFEPSWLAKSASAEEIAHLLRDFLAGRLPTHSPEKLHDRVHQLYSREQVLPKFIEAAVGGYGG